MPSSTPNRAPERWPALPYAAWQDTAATLHMWTQIVGKVRTRHAPWTNHSWHVTLYVTPRGLTTSSICVGERTFRIDFDFVDHDLVFSTCDGDVRRIPLRPRTTADFFAAVQATLRELELPDAIHGRPNEVDPAIPFAEDREHASYDADAAWRFWRVLLQVDRVFRRFRAGFVGKSSPPHFFWGSFDFAVTRFSGRPAPEHPGGIPNLPDRITREAYSHEVHSAGFWPGGPLLPEPVFYAYAYPTPAGFADAAVRPASARWNATLGEFVLPYEDVRRSASPDETLMEFLQSSYAAAADAGRWDRVALERTFDL